MTLMMPEKPSLEEALVHAGIKGMRWGVRKKEDRTARKLAKREEKAKKYESQAAGYQKRINKLNAELPNTNVFLKRGKKKEIKELTEFRDIAKKDAIAVREGKRTDFQKKVLIGAGVVAAVLVAATIHENLQSGEFNRLSIKGKAFLDGRKTPEFKKNLSLADKNMDVDELTQKVVAHVNPDYNNWESGVISSMGARMNCRRATFTYEMRRRGFDVQATKTTTASGQHAVGVINALSPGKDIQRTSMTGLLTGRVREAIGKTRGKATPLTDALNNNMYGEKSIVRSLADVDNDRIMSGKTIFDSLSKNPDGARGELGMGWKMGGGHSIAWEKVKGKIVIFDTQSGKVFKDAESFDEVAGNMKTAAFTRLDDKALNTDYLLRWMKDAN